jgi:AraC-like DNA-binding protein
MYTYGKSVSLTEVAEKCGFTDYVYFSKKFKAVTGIAPRTYIADTFGHNDPT